MSHAVRLDLAPRVLAARLAHQTRILKCLVDPLAYQIFTVGSLEARLAHQIFACRSRHARSSYKTFMLVFSKAQARTEVHLKDEYRAQDTDQERGDGQAHRPRPHLP